MGMLKLGLIGYGKMGQAIHGLAQDYGCSVELIIDPEKVNCQSDITRENSERVDVFLDFSLPHTVISNIEKCIRLKKNIVVGTTGWLDRIDCVKELVESSGVGLIYAMNFSVGMNTFFHLVQRSAELFNSLSDYDIYGLELHHKNKADSPSGTANTIAEIILKNIERKTKLVTERLETKISDHELHFPSVRSGTITGIHTVGFDSPFDSIELTHRAKSSEGFAIGALKAAIWLSDKKGFYSFQHEFLKII